MEFFGIIPSIADPTQLAITSGIVAATFTSYFLYLLGKSNSSIAFEILIAIFGSMAWAIGIMSSLVAFGVHF